MQRTGKSSSLVSGVFRAGAKNDPVVLRKGSVVGTILTAVAVFISTSIDYLVVLTILFATQGARHGRAIYGGQYLGTGILVAASLAAAFLLNLIPHDWVIGLLGLIPIALGIRVLVVDEDVDEDEIADKVRGRGSKLAAFTALTLALGGDNLGVYVPYFSRTTGPQVLVILAVFAVGIFLLCQLSRWLAKVPAIGETVEKYEKVIVPVVFIGLGVYLLVENGTVGFLWGAFTP